MIWAYAKIWDVKLLVFFEVSLPTNNGNTPASLSLMCCKREAKGIPIYIYIYIGLFGGGETIYIYVFGGGSPV